MREAAAAFESAGGAKIEVVAGPTPQWLPQAKTDADLVFSGSETMMTDFVVALEPQLSHREVTPLYLRPLAMLVRPGNPRRIRSFQDLLRPGTSILVVNGAGQNGAWEDAAGRKGDISTVKALRANIAAYARNSAEAKATWVADPSIDVWLIWNIWQVASPTLAEVVEIAPDYAVYRDTGVAITSRGIVGSAAARAVWKGRQFWLERGRCSVTRTSGISRKARLSHHLHFLAPIAT